ncbi:MAG TPA: hypothetical protein VM243_15305 [Phycisphaerae bacterium]|nr:hypothetical protein [Phycisphaerae bacterium]
MGRYYILRSGDVIEEPDYDKWARWYETSYQEVRGVASSQAAYGTVETVFLGLNMSLSKDDPPKLFETRVHGGWFDDQWERYSTLEDARAGHEAWVARVAAAEEDELLPPGCPTW